MKLFLFPFAGSSARAYDKFYDYVDPEITLIPIEYAGHGTRSNEAFYESIETAADDVFESIKDQIQDEPYALFGHSMGGLILYETFGKIKAEGLRMPEHVFISASAHTRKDKGYKIYELPDEAFLDEVNEVGGLEPILLKDESLKSYFIPILKSDYRLVEEYKVKNVYPFDFGLTICYGKKDVESLPEQVLEWKKYGQKEIDIFPFEEGHFYFKKDPSVLCNIINNTLLQE